jgi:hypothetical protein
MAGHGTDTAAPPFGEAKASLERFLGEQGWPGRVVWVFREDVMSYKRKVWVWRREGGDGEAERLTEELYEAGRAKGLGVLLSATIRFADAMGCHVWVPGTELAAQYAMMPRGLKLAVLTEPLEGMVVRSRIRWWLRNGWNGGWVYGNKAPGVVEWPSREAGEGFREEASPCGAGQPGLR